jgi:hypothetical protein
MKLTDIIRSNQQRYLDKVETLYPATAQCLQDGEIAKADWIKWKEAVSYLCDSAREGVRDKWVNAGKFEALPTDLQWFDDGYGTQGVKSWAKKFTKLSPTSQQHGYVTDMKDIYTQLMTFINLTDALKPLVVTRTTQRATVKAQAAVELQKKFTDSQTLVALLSQHKEEYANTAIKRADEHYEYLMSVLEKHFFDLDQAAPKPTSKMSREQYLRMQNYRYMLMDMTTPVGGGANQTMRSPSPEKKAKYAEECKANAIASYEAWVAKIIQKIGKPVVKATMKGDPWSGSTINVTCDDGEEQIWHTQMIINRSVYNKLFNQFPTRRQK